MGCGYPALMWSTIVLTIQQEFSDLTDVAQLTRVTVRVLMALALGALIGFNRERQDASAGLRTHMLVALGAALFVLVPQQMGMSQDAISRVLQGLVSGIGFLGAGAVLKLNDQEKVQGLTTAASIWTTAAIGITAGLGLEATAILCTVLAWVILSLLVPLGQSIGKRHRQDNSDAQP